MVYASYTSRGTKLGYVLCSRTAEGGRRILIIWGSAEDFRKSKSLSVARFDCFALAHLSYRHSVYELDKNLWDIVAV